MNAAGEADGSEIRDQLTQLRLVGYYPNIYRVDDTSQVVVLGFLIHQQYFF